MTWFIRRPHAIDRMREYMGFAATTRDATIEAALRGALDEALKNPKKTFLAGCNPGEYAVRIDIPQKHIVYAILRKSENADGESYNYLVPTVITGSMYNVWTTDGKLGDIGELHGEGSSRTMPVLKPQLHMRWANGDGKDHGGDYCADDVPEQIRKLLLKGVKRDDIKIYREVPFKIEVSIEGVTP